MSNLALAGSIASEFQVVAGELQQPAEILQRFEAEFAATKCNVREFDKPDSVTTPAEYKAFDWFPGAGNPTFINRIGVVPGRPEAEQKISRWHEGFHAIQASTVPAVHFTPYNMGNLNITLSPASAVLLTLLTERAAVANVSMLAYLDGTPEIREAAAREAGTVADFEAAMNANNQRIDVALNRVAREALMKNSNEYLLGWGEHGARANNEPLWLRNYYVWQALKSYHSCNRFTYGDFLYDTPPPIFVKLGEEDVAQIGNILGYNAFGTPDNPDSFFTRNPTLTERHWDWMCTLNRLFKVPDESQLPTVKEALAQYYGITPEEAMKFSKAYTHGGPVIKPHGPESRKIVPFALGTYVQPEHV